MTADEDEEYTIVEDEPVRPKRMPMYRPTTANLHVFGNRGGIVVFSITAKDQNGVITNITIPYNASDAKSLATEIYNLADQMEKCQRR